MLVEVRTYRIRHGLRANFLEFFRQHAVPLQQSIGIGVVGPFVDIEDPDVFFWLRAFPSAGERDRMKHALYEGDVWKNELESIAMPMLDSYSVALTALPPGFVNDLADPAR